MISLIFITSPVLFIHTFKKCLYDINAAKFVSLITMWSCNSFTPTPGLRYRRSDSRLFSSRTHWFVSQQNCWLSGRVQKFRMLFFFPRLGFETVHHLDLDSSLTQRWSYHQLCLMHWLSQGGASGRSSVYYPNLTLRHCHTICLLHVFSSSALTTPPVPGLVSL